LAYRFSEDDARRAIDATARAIRAITALERQDRATTEALADVRARFDAEEDDHGAGEFAAARGRHAALTDQLYALRRTLSDVLVDARADAPEGILVADVEPRLTPAPKPVAGIDLTPLEKARVLIEVQGWVGQQTGHWLRELKTALGDVRRLIVARDEPEFRSLIAAVDQVLMRL
jgi:hypothetical protein